MSAALDPNRSVVVEACAGSGKTWLLVSRIVRLLLAGAAPATIVALTFTRKAAAEMQERLHEWLTELALAPPQARTAFLVARGVPEALASSADMQARAAGLAEVVLAASPSVTIDTFHGWFLKLVAMAPLAARTDPDAQLSETTGNLREAAWRALGERCFSAQGEGAKPAVGRQPDQLASARLREAATLLLNTYGIHNLRNSVMGFLDHQAEWQAFVTQFPADGVQAWLDAQCPKRDAGAGARWVREEADSLEQYLSYLEAGDTHQRKRAQVVRKAQSQSSQNAHEEGVFEASRNLFFDSKGAQRDLSSSKTLAKNLGPEKFAACLRAHEDLTISYSVAKTQTMQAQAHATQSAFFALGAALIDCYAQAKRDAGVMDFADIEQEAARLMADAEHGPYLQARLDTRYRHVLVDEFQDTNPTQWQVLHAWLANYEGQADKPTVMLVGDTKQSIYRFRRAEPALMTSARDWLVAIFGAATEQQNLTRRNAKNVVAAVNSVFTSLEGFSGFVPHETTQSHEGAVQVLPLAAAGGDDVPDDDRAELAANALVDSSQESAALSASHNAALTAVLTTVRETPQTTYRNPLTTARQETEDLRDGAEADAIAAAITQAIAQTTVNAGTADARPARYGDVMVLAAKRARFAALEAALRRANIPFITSRRGGLVEALEVQDLLALLASLDSPHDNLALAQALKSPMFGLTDEDLLDLTQDFSDPPPENALWMALSEAFTSNHPLHGRFQPVYEKLTSWRTLAGQVPVHDLLDRIYHESNLKARYAASVLPHHVAGVLANLDALMALALGVESGRYPSLTQFVFAVRDAARRTANDDAPDEGTVVAPDAVRLMTIHAAKGLESPIVVLSDAHWRAPTYGQAKQESYSTLVGWPVGAPAPEHFSVLTDKEGTAEFQLPWREQARQAQARERQNLLYVAMTRAKDVLIVSGRESKQADPQSPYKLVEEALKTANATP